jgi:pantetheine-phosphate adenylyltransferase
LFDEIVIAILNNPEKNPMFTIAERREMLTEILPQINSDDCKLIVEDFQGLLVEYAKEREVQTIVRGIRAVSDYEYELQMALMNRRLAPDVQTVFLMAADKYSYVSSRLIKQVFTLGGTVDGLVPVSVEAKMRDKLTT